jgi:hypothetical protein
MHRSAAVADLFANGRVVDCILGLMLLEVLAMAWWRHRSGNGLRATELLASIGAGAALLLALKTALVGAPWPQAAFWLLVALAAHAADLTLRSAHKRAI